MNAASDALERKLDALLRKLASRHPVRQAVMSVESGDRSFRWIGGAGSGGETVSGGSPFFLASIDKLLNATVTLKLSETNRIELDAPIASYLSSGLTIGLHRDRGRDRSDEITIRHLLAHASGLADWLEDRPKGGRSVVERIVEDGDQSFEIDRIAEIVRGLRPHFAPQDLQARGPRVRYSDTNYMLLIAIIESVTGETLHNVHEHMIFRPLDLKHTYFPGSSEPSAPTPEPLMLRADGRPLKIPLFLRSTRGIYSTAADTLAFMRGLVRGELFDRPDTFLSMQSRWNRFGFPRDRAALRAPGWPIEYGLGLMRFHLPRVLSPLKPVPAVIGHTGSTGCWLFHCPSRDLFLAGGVDEVSAGAVPYRWLPRILREVPDEIRGKGD